ncbi:type IV pilin [Halorhabdus sp. CUG00001]|uniref:type IV pilin n=1 Tax=Halorhabdus sp. CUG00001 TaxID=2600297 RepID=UPI00131B1BF7|nr:type IV pilin N-terminal domain-containing protein [Halorhabdus sp. CUG00001]
MDLKRLFDADDRGVSPVIGVILMVAITVILAAVIATFVMNMGPPEDQAPQASWSIDYENDNVTISHDNGEAVQAKELSVKLAVNGSVVDTYEYSNSSDLPFAEDAEISASSTDFSIGNGDAVTSKNKTVSEDMGNVTSVELIWESSSADKSSTLKKWEN